MRVFFALWPPPELAAALHRVAQTAARQCGGRVMREETLHITLDFVGGVPNDLLPKLRLAAASLAAPALSLRVDRLDYLRRKSIVWAGCSETPGALAALAATLKAALRTQCGLAPEPRFVPHLTLLRNVRRPPEAAAMAPLEWIVRDFRLIHSELHSDGARYAELGRWPLGD